MSESEKEVLLDLASVLVESDNSKSRNLGQQIRRLMKSGKAFKGNLIDQAYRKFLKEKTILAESLLKTDEGAAMEEARKKANEAKDKFEAAVSSSRINYMREQRERGEFVFTSATSWQTVIRASQAKKDQLNASREYFSSRMDELEEGDTITSEELSYMLPYDSKLRASLVTDNKTRESQMKKLKRHKKKSRARFNQLISEGKTSEEAIEILRSEEPELNEETIFTKAQAQQFYNDEYDEVKASIDNMTIRC